MCLEERASIGMHVLADFLLEALGVLDHKLVLLFSFRNDLDLANIRSNSTLADLMKPERRNKQCKTQKQNFMWNVIVQ